jgi:alpha-D-ribose 1-methylphosphonate 5-triphosphate synthase subunit PhnH
MEIEYDIEEINRHNFRKSLEALARPGTSQTIAPLFDSALLAMASVFLYAEVTHHYSGKLDFEMVRALCGSKPVGAEAADYLFFDSPEKEYLLAAKTGSPESPELNATLIFYCPAGDHGTSSQVVLSGPGINGSKEVDLPVGQGFIETLWEKNEDFPMGIDLFLITDNNTLLGLPRTTHIEVIV